MTRAPTHYELLEVRNDSTFEQIRSAYLRLMKRHHPDIAGEQVGTADFLPLINQAYKMLGDPIKRSAYDAELKREAEASRPVHATRRPPTAAPVRAKPVASLAQHWWALWAVLAIALSIAAMMLLPSRPGAAERDDSPALGIGWFLPETIGSESGGAARLPAHDAIRREVLRGASASAPEATRQSTQCFDHARDWASVEAAQLCVVFDEAFLFTHKDPRGSLPPYFNDLVVSLRHSRALDVAPGDPRLGRLSQATLAALMAELAPAVEAPKQRIQEGLPAPSDQQAAVVALPQSGTPPAALTQRN